MARNEAVNSVAMEEITVKNALLYGDTATKCSAVILGAGNLARKQIVKGLLFLALEVIFIIYMATTGIASLGDFITLGTKTGEEVFNET